MTKSTTWMVSMDKLAANEKLASLMVRLMTVLQDFSLANDAQEKWKNEESPKLKDRRTGAARYFLRLQMSHLLEAFKIIEDEVEKDADLKAAIEACDTQTKKSYAAVLAFMKSPDYKLLLRIRNNVGFHYDDKVVRQSLARLARKREKLKKDGKYTNDHVSLTLGREALDWYLAATEPIENDIVIHGIFGLPEDEAPADLQKKTDEIVMRLHEIAYAFADFGGHFVKHHAKG